VVETEWTELVMAGLLEGKEKPLSRTGNG